jgi:hypothetical protein
LKLLNYHRKTLQGIDTSNGFLNRSLIAQEIIARIDKCNIKQKSICTAKETIEGRGILQNNL